MVSNYFEISAIPSSAQHHWNEFWIVHFYLDSHPQKRYFLIFCRPVTDEGNVIKMDYYDVTEPNVSMFCQSGARLSWCKWSIWRWAHLPLRWWWQRWWLWSACRHGDRTERNASPSLANWFLCCDSAAPVQLSSSSNCVVPQHQLGEWKTSQTTNTFFFLWTNDFGKALPWLVDWSDCPWSRCWPTFCIQRTLIWNLLALV